MNVVRKCFLILIVWDRSGNGGQTRRPRRTVWMLIELETALHGGPLAAMSWVTSRLWIMPSGHTNPLLKHNDSRDNHHCVVEVLSYATFTFRCGARARIALRNLCLVFYAGLRDSWGDRRWMNAAGRCPVIAPFHAQPAVSPDASAKKVTRSLGLSSNKGLKM